MISRLITSQCNFSVFPGARGPRDLVCLHINARSMIWAFIFDVKTPDAKAGYCVSCKTSTEKASQFMIPKIRFLLAAT